MVVILQDVNDEPPRFTKSKLFVEVDETDTEMPTNRTSDANNHPSIAVVKLFVEDRDLYETNQFRYKIVREGYSRTMDKIHESDFIVDNSELYVNYSNSFTLSTNSDGSASLRIIRPLDYEIPMQRFITLKVLVSDMGEDFSDRYHIDVCFVCIKVRDTNDNKPRFVQHFINVSLAENIALGTIITKFFATDYDQNGHSPVLYTLDSETNKKRYFSINSEGFVRLNRLLDRETISTHIVKVMASDTDEPRLTATATLVVNVDDINDNAPFLINTSLPPVYENTKPSKLGELIAFDRDDYGKG